MSQLEVSIVLPVFNARKYIKNTLESISNQTIANDRYEVIIIDDGATDGTGEICREYAENYTNFIYKKHPNSGVCVSRNEGIKLAKGKYIAFCDHDDEYVENYLECLIKTAKESDADVVKCGTLFYEEYAKDKWINREEKYKAEVIDRKQLVDRFNYLPISFFGVWNSLYRTELIKEGDVYFPEKMKYGQEDIYFNTLIIPYISKIAFCEKCLYKHYRRLSQSTSAQYHKERIQNFSESFQLQVDILGGLVEKENWDYTYSLLYARMITGLMSYCDSTNTVNGKEVFLESLSTFEMNNPYCGKKNISYLWKLYKKSKKYTIVMALFLADRNSL